ncbi:hypothetical protein CRE_23128 [Caenorhabditis remanei]|uniref:Uncharacterized protein n=1 Tax=Caenorhabditis remanei TaxID=31234 RepID=E3ND27_CAERE|nr:hypothetical protein CRE_23128 [Caenorhabditis remanei]
MRNLLEKLQYDPTKNPTEVLADPQGKEPAVLDGSPIWTERLKLATYSIKLYSPYNIPPTPPTHPLTSSPPPFPRRPLRSNQPPHPTPLTP